MDSYPFRSTTFDTGKPKKGWVLPNPPPVVAHYATFGRSRRAHKRHLLAYASRIGCKRIKFRGLRRTIINADTNTKGMLVAWNTKACS